MTHVLLILAAFLGGIINALAGGGGLLVFPALLFAGLTPVDANASSIVALFPGGWLSAWAYRRDMLAVTHSNIRGFAGVSIAGALAGAALLLYTPNSIFAAIVAWLMLAATSIFAVGSFAPLHVTDRVRLGPRTALAVLFVIAIYGGYFGGGIGFLMLSAFVLIGMRDINAMNGLKLVLVGLMTAASTLTFIASGLVRWPETGPMIVAGLAGGYVGAHGARRLNQKLLKGFVVALGAALTAYFFWRGA